MGTHWLGGTRRAAPDIHVPVSTMRLLILGGAGSTGRALIGDLRERDEPIGITVIPRSARELPGANQVLTGHYAQVVPEGPFRRELATFDAIVHLADGLGELQSHRRARDTQLADQLIAASRDVALAARDARVPCFIHMSSIKAICGEDDTRVLTETCAPAPTSLYGRSKLRLEQTLQQVFEGSATRLIILRNPVMYTEEKAGSIQRLLILTDTPWPLPLGGLCNRRSLLAVRNLASALVAVLCAGPTVSCIAFVLVVWSNESPGLSDRPGALDAVGSDCASEINVRDTCALWGSPPRSSQTHLLRTRSSIACALPFFAGSLGTRSFGGSADLFAGLTWDTRPDMTGSEASEDLQLAGVVTIMAIQAELGGAVKNGNCFLVKGGCVSSR